MKFSYRSSLLILMSVSSLIFSISISALSKPGGGAGYKIGDRGPAGGYIFYVNPDT